MMLVQVPIPPWGGGGGGGLETRRERICLVLFHLFHDPAVIPADEAGVNHGAFFTVYFGVVVHQKAFSFSGPVLGPQGPPETWRTVSSAPTLFCLPPLWCPSSGSWPAAAAAVAAVACGAYLSVQHQQL